MLPKSRKSAIESCTLAVLAVLTFTAFWASTASAQEDATGAPPPLQYPTPVSGHTNGSVPFQNGTTSSLRGVIEQNADAELCKILMKDGNTPIPNEATFTYDNCPAGYKTMINLRQGKVSWAEGARPMECGHNCLGFPFMSQTQNVIRPNARFAMVYGQLTFQAGVGPLNRNVTYFLEIDATCNVPAGSKTGAVTLTTHVDGPVSDDPGFLETVVNFLILPVELSQRISNAISAMYAVTTSPGLTPTFPTCTSIGANVVSPTETIDDAFVWDQAPVSHNGRGMVTASSAFKPQATLYFDRIIRNPSHLESNPSTAPSSFTLYINGVPAYIPKSGSITLPPTGGSNNQQYCRTIPMEGVDNLQILFVDNLGGATWSQFSPAQNFGGGGMRKMTTSRTFLRPGLHPGDKPISYVARDFELDYHIEYRGAPTSVSGTPTPTGGGRGGRAGVTTTPGGSISQPTATTPCTNF